MVADVSAEKVIGGAERMLDRHVRMLKDAGVQATVLTRQPDADARLSEHVADGVLEHRLAYGGDRGVFGLWQLAREARRWWRQHGGEFDVVLAEQPFTMWALLKAGCRLPRVQVCHSLACEEYATRHGLDWSWRHLLIAGAMRRLERQVFAGADQILVLSQFMRRRLAQVLQVDSGVCVLPAGADVPPPISAAKRRTIRQRLGWSGPVAITVRNLVPRTGVDLMLQAAAILAREGQGIHWCVIGDGPLRSPLQTLARDLGIAEVVEFTGYLPEEEVLLRLQAADVFILPTRSLEGFGLVTMEANACGLPVVATPVGANPEVVGRHPANRLAADATPAALADALAAALKATDTTVRERLRQHIREHASWSRHAQGLLTLLQDMAGGLPGA